jgi:hypothetical protein
MGLDLPPALVMCVYSFFFSFSTFEANGIPRTLVSSVAAQTRSSPQHPRVFGAAVVLAFPSSVAEWECDEWEFEWEREYGGDIGAADTNFTRGTALAVPKLFIGVS